jgi:regulator of sirC expression with transglutaminase-like and TPR domain
MKLEDIKFLQEVRSRSQDPEMMNRIIDVAVNGLQDRARKSDERAADMEVIASMAMNTRLFKGNENFLAQKLEKWNGKTSLRWDDQIAKLKEKNT